MDLRTSLASAFFAAVLIAAIPADRALAIPDQSLGMALMSALVDEDGTLYGGAGVVSSSKDTNHAYAVTFHRPLAHCMAVVTPNEIGYFGNAFVSAAERTVRIDIRANGSLAPATSPFYLFVFCPR